MDIVTGLFFGLIAGGVTSVAIRRQIPGGALEVVVGGIASASIVAAIFALIASTGLHLTSFLIAFMGASALVGFLAWFEQTEPRQLPRHGTKPSTKAAKASRRYIFPSGRRDARLHS
jgi:uncharacterized membrane protein YeaQ/YmgE (transglycosylase-associated protein family)